MCNLAAMINAYKRNTYTSLPKIGPFVIKGSLIFGNVPDMTRHLIRGLSSHMQLELPKEKRKKKKNTRAHTHLQHSSSNQAMPLSLACHQRKGRKGGGEESDLTDIFTLNLLILHGARQVEPVNRIHTLVVPLLLRVRRRGLDRRCSVTHSSPHNPKLLIDKNPRRMRGGGGGGGGSLPTPHLRLHETNECRPKTVDYRGGTGAQIDRDAAAVVGGKERKRQNRTKRESARAVEPAASRLSHHRTPQQGRQRRRRGRVVGLVGWKKREAILGYTTGTGNF